MSTARDIRVIAVDLDMTLVNWTGDGPFIDPAAITAFEAASQRNIRCGIASGRLASDLRSILDRAGVSWGKPFPQFLVAREKFIYWVDGDSLREETEWNAARTAEMRRLAETCLALGSGWLAALRDAGLHYEWWNLLSDYAFEIGLPTVEDAIRACAVLAEQVEDVPSATVHRNWVSANVVLSTGTKGVTLRGLADRLGISPSEVLAIGDNINDLDMVNGEYGLIGGAVGNADEEIKRAVRAAGGFVAGAPSGAGIAEIINAALGLR